MKPVYHLLNHVVLLSLIVVFQHADANASQPVQYSTAGSSPTRMRLTETCKKIAYHASTFYFNIQGFKWLSKNQAPEDEEEYSLNKYRKDRDMLLAKNELKQIQLVKQRAAQYILIIAIIATFIILFLLWNRYRLKQKMSDQLNEQIQIIRDTNHALADSEAQLLTLNATKDKFFSVLAHDLRSPLAGIVTASNTLKNNFETFEKDQKIGFIEIINSSARQLENLVNNLLYWSKSQTGRMKFSPVALNLKDIVDENFKLLRINAEKKEIQLSHTISGKEMVYGDKEMITTIIRNLLSNAIKFTNNGGSVKITSSVTNDKVVVSVSDPGVGISPGNLKRLFSFDHKISTYGTNDEAGSGLGLIICKNFVEKNGGKIWVDNTSDKGTTFKFTVPKNDINPKRDDK